MAMRDLLRRMGKKRFNTGRAAASMLFLNATNPKTIRLTRKLMIEWGATRLQRAAHGLLQGVARAQTRQPPATTGKPPMREQVVHFVNKRMPGGLPKKTARALLDIENPDYVPIIRDPIVTSGDTEAVFYFPGCGSERLFSQVGIATQAMLWHVGVQTVLPPGYLCCGYPQRGAGQFDRADKITTDNRVLFHRVANTLNYLDIRTVVVSCGTCHDQLQGYKFEEIFPGSRIIDIHEYLMEKGVRLEGITGTRYMYHDPCHSPMKSYDPLKVVDSLMNESRNGRIDRNDRCCGESGTLAVAPARRLDPGAVSQRGGSPRGRGEAARGGRRAGQNSDLVPVLPPGPEALQRRRRSRRRLHRRRDRPAPIRRELDGRVRGAGEQRRHRAGARLRPPGPRPLLRARRLDGDRLVELRIAHDGRRRAVLDYGLDRQRESSPR